ncbi:hypothetical protein BD626DRAFT_386923, partial [Schizophyllum amplum]
LPDVYQLPQPLPLAYVEWYTDLGSVDRASGLHRLWLLTRNHSVNAEIVEAAHIVRNCYLIPRFGHTADRTW